MNVSISWYGRCCFLAEIENKKILFDPYDRFNGVDIGIIDSDILLISSTWHDHGNIGASPGSHIYSYPGIEENDGLQITGIESKEDRGTPNVIFNIQYKGFSITNFADFGPTQEENFEKSVTDKERDILRSTNIAFARPMIERDKVGEVNIHNENFLKYCSPNIVFPEHYHPRDFMKNNIPENLHPKFEPANVIVDEMPDAIGYPLKEINDYKIELTLDEIKNKKSFLRFMKINPQVTYKENT